MTGRPRRCGWADAVGLRYAVRINGMDTLAVTKLDVLDACETVKICTGYRYQGDILTEFPEEERIWHEAEPVYEELSGWQTSTQGLREYGELPTKAREYLERLSELIGVGVRRGVHRARARRDHPDAGLAAHALVPEAARLDPAAVAPLTLTLSPQGRGKGEGNPYHGLV